MADTLVCSVDWNSLVWSGHTVSNTHILTQYESSPAWEGNLRVSEATYRTGTSYSTSTEYVQVADSHYVLSTSHIISISVNTAGMVF